MSICNRQRFPVTIAFLCSLVPCSCSNPKPASDAGADGSLEVSLVTDLPIQLHFWFYVDGQLRDDYLSRQLDGRGHTMGYSLCYVVLARPALSGANGEGVDVNYLLGTQVIGTQQADGHFKWAAVPSADTYKANYKLPPGSYCVQGVTQVYRFEGPGLPRTIPVRYLFDTDTRTAKVTAGQTARVQFMVVPQVDLGQKPTEWQAGEDDHYLEQLRRNVNRLKDSPIAKALNKAVEDIRLFPPKTPVAWLDLPPEYGGRREYNAEQIRLLVRWMMEYYLGPNFGDSHMRMREERTTTMDALSWLYNEVARELEKLKKARTEK
jgi:hypothetical protein